MPEVHSNVESVVLRSEDGAKLTCTCPSELGAVEALCLVVRHFLQNNAFEDLAFECELVLRECLNNAHLHGNGGDAAKRLGLVVEAHSRGIQLTISDEGPGFDCRSHIACDPSSAAQDGRGLALINTYATDVSFNESGNAISLKVLRRPERMKLQ